MRMSKWATSLSPVIAGLDPAIHLASFESLMDARVKPAHDG
jgi:hypothetical protein